MLVFAIFGVCVNLSAVFFTHGGESLNQKAVNLHMLEDVFGWIIVSISSFL
jgi:cobalt-zinc-cadmium efflux system protein